MTSCTWNTVTTKNSSYNFSRLNSVIVNNDFLYYSVQSPEDFPDSNLTYSLYQYNVKTQEKKVIDKGVWIGGVAKIDDKLYYTVRQEDLTYNIISINITDMLEKKIEAQITCDCVKSYHEKEYVYYVNGHIYINFDNMKTYCLESGNVIEKSDIVSMFPLEEYIYYSDNAGNVFKYNTKTEENYIIVSEDDIKEKRPLLRYGLKTHNIFVEGNKLYFIVSSPEYLNGNIMCVDMDNGGMELLQIDKNTLPATFYIYVYNEQIYFIHSNGDLMCIKGRECMTIMKKVYDFDIINNTLYCFKTEADKIMLYTQELEKKDADFEVLF